MPLFEYECGSCGKRFEELVSSASSHASCPECGAGQVEKLPSAFAVGSRRVQDAPRPCGACGDPRGPGACRLDAN